MWKVFFFSLLLFNVYSSINNGGFITSIPSLIMNNIKIIGGIIVTLSIIVGIISQKGKSRSKVPEKMKALMLTKFISGQTANASDYKECFSVNEIDTPKPRRGQILVKIEASPINPSDTSTLQGSYNASQRANLPCQLGYEASGTVVQNGGGLFGGLLMGKKVAIVTQGSGKMWSEYAVVNAATAIPLPEDVSFKEGCSCFVNPLTALAFLEISKNSKAKTIILTASGSALCKMVIKLCRRFNINVISIVRSHKTDDFLKSFPNVKKIVYTCDDDWTDQLKEVAESLNATVCFDAVAGPNVGSILKSMPKRSTVYVYGGLSKQHSSGIRSTELIFRSSSVKGFWLTAYIRRKGFLGMLQWVKQVRNLIKTDLATEMNQEFPLDDIVNACTTYFSDMSKGKSIICPSKPSKLGEIFTDY